MLPSPGKAVFNYAYPAESMRSPPPRKADHSTPSQDEVSKEKTHSVDALVGSSRWIADVIGAGNPSALDIPPTSRTENETALTIVNSERQAIKMYMLANFPALVALPHYRRYGNSL